MRNPAWQDKKIREFQFRLLRWYSGHKRDLPWRRDPTPYHVWISEIMLQQTRIETMVPFYERFISRFPDVQTLAASSETDVLNFWAGLGYYSRAQNLRRAAIQIMQEFDGKIPSDPAALRRLPGIGRYTAGAIGSIAFHQPLPVVDGNIRRVLARLFGIRKQVPEQFYWFQAETFLPEARTADFNQAFMELGALVCVPRIPLCGKCPANGFCAARLKGMENKIPQARKEKKAQDSILAVLVVENKNSILLAHKKSIRFVPGAWSLPAAIIPEGRHMDAVMRELARELLGRRVKLHKRATVRHAITFRRIVAAVYYCRRAGNISPNPDCQWIPMAEADQYLTSSLYRKSLNAVSDNHSMPFPIPA
jgi:A/G-specific adenine glycosylase